MWRHCSPSQDKSIYCSSFEVRTKKQLLQKHFNENLLSTSRVTTVRRTCYVQYPAFMFNHEENVDDNTACKNVTTFLLFVCVICPLNSCSNVYLACCLGISFQNTCCRHVGCRCLSTWQSGCAPCVTTVHGMPSWVAASP